MDNLAMRKVVVLLGTLHSIQYGENSPSLFKSMLNEECEKYQIIAIAEEAKKTIKTIGYMIAAERNYKHLYADPDAAERRKLGILLPEDIRKFLQDKYVEKYPELAIWPRDDKGLPDEVRKDLDVMSQQSDRMREEVWHRNIEELNLWPLLFVCGYAHFAEFEKLLSKSGIQVIRSHEKWRP